jgi:hypothetical protein
MAISSSFNREKLNPTISKALSFTGAIAQGTDEFIVDINLTITKDDTTTVVKTVQRIVIPLNILNNKLTVIPKQYVFPGSATTYSSGGTTPLLSAGTIGNIIDLNTFLTQAGDTPENS